MSETPLLRTERLCKTYPDGQVNALVDVSLSIRPGEFVAIMGASGSGKSTLLNMLGALDRPTSGDVFYEDRPLSAIPDLDRFRAQKIGFVFQSFFLLPTLTALENVQIPMFEGPLGVRQRSAKASELLKLVGMSHRLHHRPPQLSVGERQRIAIARSLANDPLLLLADEPTGNLDSRTAAEVLDLFAHLNRDKGMTLVMVTHGQEVADRAQRIIRMRDGRIYAEDFHPSRARSAAE
ncbi:MAG TPA: ABC transporter ATP-binding protein [Gemmataceae bacterium]